MVRPSFLQGPWEVLYSGLTALPPQVPGIGSLKVQSTELDFDSVVSTAPPRPPLADRDGESDDQGIAVKGPFLDLEEGGGPWGPTPSTHRGSPSSTKAYGGGITPTEL